MSPPGSWLAVLGGGQLGRMFAHAAQAMGYRVAVLDPDRSSPAGAVADLHIEAGYEDRAALDRIAATCAGATTEFENVPAAALDHLAASIPTRPAAAAVRIAQDRSLEKDFFARAGLDVAPYRVLRSTDDCGGLPASMLPGIVKTARMGYDGKGQVSVATGSDVARAFASLGSVMCVLEQRIDLALEISALVGRSATGDVRVWSLAENQHRNGILDVSIVPARVDGDLARRARDAAIRVAESLDYVGVLCVEMFVTRDGGLLINEMAPRPHNSGHWSIDGSHCSQFEQQARIVAGLPLGDVSQHTSAVMVNVLGDAWFDAASGAMREPDWSAVVALSRAKLHLYGKTEPRRARKMGHVTCLGDDVDGALAMALRVKRILGMPEDQELRRVAGGPSPATHRRPVTRAAS